MEIQCINELASKMGIPVNYLLAVSCSIEKYYHSFSILKRSGGYREISAPNLKLKGIQAWILRKILDPIKPDQAATGFYPGSFLPKNALPHAENIFFINVDIKDFFPSIHFGKVLKIFLGFGYERSVAIMLTKLCTYKGGLPQGAVTSPAISNLVARSIDRRIRGFLNKVDQTGFYEFAYTRYADDITISTNQRDVTYKVYKQVSRILKSEGFAPNSKKTRFVKRGDKIRITGFVLDIHTNNFSIGQKKIRELLNAIFMFYKHGKLLPALPHGEESINGWVSYLKSVDPAHHQKLTDFILKIKA